MSIFGYGKAHWDRVREMEDANFWQDVFLRVMDRNGDAEIASVEATFALNAKREALK